MRLRRAMALSALYLGAAAIAWGAAELWLRHAGLGDRCLWVPTPAAERAGPVEYARLDPDLGWVSRAPAGEINEQGFRDPRPFTAASGALPATRVMVLGDSFVWGSKVEADESIPRRLEAALGETTVAFAVAAPGWGIDQMYLAYRRYRDVLRPNVVVLAFIDDDIARVLETWRPFERLPKPAFRVEHGALVPKAPTDDPYDLGLWLADSVVARCVTREIRRETTARTIARVIVQQLVLDTRARGERLLVVRIPDGVTNRSAMGRLRWRLRGSPTDDLPVASVDLRPAFDDARRAGRSLYAWDGHLDADGSDLVGRALAAAIGATSLATHPGD